MPTWKSACGCSCGAGWRLAGKRLQTRCFPGHRDTTGGVSGQSSGEVWVASVADSQKWLVSTPGGQSIQVRGLEVTAAYYVANATSVKIFNEGHYSSPGAPQDVWIVVIEAPPQAGFSAISGNAVINASTRQAVEGDFFATFAKPGPSPTS